MKKIVRVLGIPLFSFEEILTESDLLLLGVSDDESDLPFGFVADEEEFDEDEVAPFGFGGR